MKILVADIETSPNLAHVWSIWNVNVGLPQLLTSGTVIGVGYQWVGEKTVHFLSDHHGGHAEMIQKTYDLLGEADAVITYNGKNFDRRWLNTEFALAGLPPHSPTKDIDLLPVVKKNFRFPSNKLAYVTKALGLSGKISHSGHEMWVKCLADDPVAWAQMSRYCKQDVRTTTELYDRLLPWISNHPHMGLYGPTVEEAVCQTCGSANVQKRGFAYTALGRFQQYQCMSAGCGRWSRGAKMLDHVDLRGTS